MCGYRVGGRIRAIFVIGTAPHSELDILESSFPIHHVTYSHFNWEAQMTPPSNLSFKKSNKYMIHAFNKYLHFSSG